MKEKLQHDEINILELIEIVLRRKRFILCFSFGLALAVFGILFLQPNLYEARAVIIPANDSQNGAAGAAAMNGMVNQLGLTMGSSSKTGEIIAQLKSKFVRETIIRKHSLVSVLLKEGVFSKYKFIPAYIAPANNLNHKTDNEQIWQTLRFLENAVTINNKDKDGVIEVSVLFQNPKIAVNIVKYFLDETTDRMSNEAKRVARKNRIYLESIVDKTADPLIKMNVYNQIAQQIQTEMAAEAKEDFAFKVIDPPKEPDRKAKPYRAISAIVTFVVGLFIATFLTFLIEFVESNEKARSILKAEKNNLKRIMGFVRRNVKMKPQMKNSTKHQEEC